MKHEPHEIQRAGRITGRRSSQKGLGEEPKLVRTPERVSPYRPAEIPPEKEILPSDAPRIREPENGPFNQTLEQLIPEMEKKETDRQRSKTRQPSISKPLKRKGNYKPKSDTSR